MRKNIIQYAYIDNDQSLPLCEVFMSNPERIDGITSAASPKLPGNDHGDRLIRMGSSGAEKPTHPHRRAMIHAKRGLRNRVKNKGDGWGVAVREFTRSVA